MRQKSVLRFLGFQSDNLKSKTCTEPSRSIENLKLVGIFAIVVVLTVCGARAEAQQTGKSVRIGYLDNSTVSGSAVLTEAFRQEMRKLGWIEGKSFTIEYRFAEQKRERLPELTADLDRLKVDLIVVASTSSATSTIPIIMASTGDPVATGLIAGLARPGGNVTGLAGLSPELNTKRLVILKDAVPKLARVGLLTLTGANIATDLQVRELRAAALALKLRLEEIETQSDAKGLGIAFQSAKQKQVNAIMTTASPRFTAERKRIVELAGKNRLPAIYFQKEFVDEGGSCPTGWTTMTCTARPVTT